MQLFFVATQCARSRIVKLHEFSGSLIIYYLPSVRAWKSGKIKENLDVISRVSLKFHNFTKSYFFLWKVLVIHYEHLYFEVFIQVVLA